METPYEKRIFEIALVQAQRLGLKGDDGQDCAMEFVVQLLGANKRIAATAPPPDSVAWITRCAYNHACNYQRNITRRKSHEQSFTERYGIIGSEIAEESPSARSGPRTLTMRKELWEHVTDSLQNFTYQQRDIFLRYYLNSQSIASLAELYKRSPHAIEVCLSNVRKRLAVLLKERGWTEADARSLFRTSKMDRKDILGR